MTIFEAVKSQVTPQMAAEHWGLTVGRNGMICCPFHEDRHPSLKLNEDYFYCFGCGAKGDVIDFTSRFLGLTEKEAAQKLAADFGIREVKPSVMAKLHAYKARADDEKHCSQVLREYLRILKDWKTAYAPPSPNAEPDPRFVEACHMLECTQYMVDLLELSPPNERAGIVEDMMKDGKIALLQERLDEIREDAHEQT